MAAICLKAKLSSTMFSELDFVAACSAKCVRDADGNIKKKALTSK